MTTENTEFCDYVKFILQRMETNPEDFHIELIHSKQKITKYPRFKNLSSELWEFGKNGNLTGLWIFSKEERVAMRDAYAKLRREAMLKEALTAIMEPQKESEGITEFHLFAPLTPHPNLPHSPSMLSPTNNINSTISGHFSTYTGSGDTTYSTNTVNKTP